MQIVDRLKACEKEESISFLANSLQWKYGGKDYSELTKLQLFKVLHKGNSMLKKAWGREINPEDAEKMKTEKQAISCQVLQIL